MCRFCRTMCRFALLFLALGSVSLACGAAERQPPVLKPIGGSHPVLGAHDELVFVVGGDNRPTEKGAPLPPVFAAILQEIGWIHPGLVLWSGDAVYGYCDSAAELEDEYQRFMAIAERPGVPLYNAPGNHEIHDDVSRCSDEEKQHVCAAQPCAVDAYRRRFGDLYGSFNVGDIHFVGLDAEQIGTPHPEIDPDQMKWLRDDLEAHKSDRAIFVFSHSEFYSSPLIDFGSGPSHPAIGNRVELHELFRRYPVKAVFSGHEHLYWREPAENHDFVNYIVSGGAGAPLYAPPDRGGFAHYLLVRVSGKGRDLRVSYNVIEPGHLGVAEGARTPAGDTLWFVNGNDTTDPVLPIGKLAVTLPAGQYGSCEQFRAGVQAGYAIAACTDAADGVEAVFAPFTVKHGGSAKLWVGHKKS
jgi:hypothetical protein